MGLGGGDSEKIKEWRGGWVGYLEQKPKADPRYGGLPLWFLGCEMKINGADATRPATRFPRIGSSKSGW